MPKSTPTQNRPDDDLAGLPFLKNYRVRQVTTHGHDRPIVAMLPTWKEFAGTMHRDYVAIPPGGSWEFPGMEGPGRIVNIWCTAMPGANFDPFQAGAGASTLLKEINILGRVLPSGKFPSLLKNVWWQIYFDGEEFPSVEAPMGDFFGVGFGEYKQVVSRYLAMTAGGYVCQFPMPFRHSARVRLVNKNPALWIPAFYGAVTYLSYEDELPLENAARFHARYREEFPTTRGQPYLILDTASMGSPDAPGHYMGVVLNTEGANARAGYYFLEGNTKIWVDGEAEQSLEYTGLEDYYQGAWYYLKTRGRGRTEFSAPYHGLTVKTLNRSGFIGSYLFSTSKKMRLSQYRFHPEGIPFEHGIHITVHHGEFDEVPANFSSVAYWYQND